MLLVLADLGLTKSESRIRGMSLDLRQAGEGIGPSNKVGDSPGVSVQSFLAYRTGGDFMSAASSFVSVRPAVTALLLLLAATFAAPFGQTQGSRPSAVTPRASFAEPAISPNSSEIAFVSGGDIWSVPVAGGTAHLLVSHPATESRPMYAPDGSRLAFMSTRAGSADIWILNLATGETTRLTHDDGTEQLDGWSRDGRWIYFSTSSHDVAGMSDVYRIRAEGGTPMPVSADRYASEFMASPAPDGTATAVVYRGFGLTQWWRKGHSHLDESELWLVRDGKGDTPQSEQLVGRGAKQLWPMWSPDGKSLYFVSDRDGAQNLWVRAGASAPKAITRFKDGRVLWPTISYDGKVIAFERDFGVWSFDVARGQAREVPITLHGASASPTPEHLSLTSNFQDLVLSPDGKKVAFTARGDVFAASAADGGDAARVTSTPAVEGQLTWAPDSRRLAYAANRNGAWHIFSYDFGTREEVALTSGPLSDAFPQFSPDGKLVAFVRDARELRVVDVLTKQDRPLAQGYFDRVPLFFPWVKPLAWSPDGRWIAYLAGGTKLFIDAYLVPLEGGSAQQASFLSNTRGNSVAWSPDGTFLLLDSGMRIEPGVLARVDLLPRVPKFREDQFRELFREDLPARTTPVTPSPLPAGAPAESATGAKSAKPATRPVEVVFDGIRQRLSFIPVGVDVTFQTISPDGKLALILATAEGQQNLYTYSLDELATETPVARQLTSTPGRKSAAQFTPDGKSVFYLEQGRINSVSLETRVVKPLAVRADMDLDFAAAKMDVFYQAWEFLNDNFYDGHFHGVDWPAVRTQYAPLIAGARTPEEMRRLLNLMVGELNASHMGVSGPPGDTEPSTGRLGLHFARSDYEQNGNLRVTEVIPLSPAALAGVKTGEYLLTVDGTRMAAGVDLDTLLDHKIGRQVVLTVATSADGSQGRHEVTVRPTNASTEKGLMYRAWCEEKRAYVAKTSAGRLGYVHMFNMGGDAIAQLNADMDSEDHAREGVVFDIRNNSGGFVNGSALDILLRPNYVMMQRRGAPFVPGRPFLGQRALELPTILVTNQHTLSDGENFTEGYRVMKLGKVVGEPTAGWDVYTWGGTMADGTTVRLPYFTNAQLDHAPLELVSRRVDIPVDRPLGESYTGRDAQLDAAVRELLAQLRP